MTRIPRADSTAILPRLKMMEWMKEKGRESGRETFLPLPFSLGTRGGSLSPEGRKTYVGGGTNCRVLSSRFPHEREEEPIWARFDTKKMLASFFVTSYF